MSEFWRFLWFLIHIKQTSYEPRSGNPRCAGSETVSRCVGMLNITEVMNENELLKGCKKKKLQRRVFIQLEKTFFFSLTKWSFSFSLDPAHPPKHRSPVSSKDYQGRFEKDPADKFLLVAKVKHARVNESSLEMQRRSMEFLCVWKARQGWLFFLKGISFSSRESVVLFFFFGYFCRNERSASRNFSIFLGEWVLYDVNEVTKQVACWK